MGGILATSLLLSGRQVSDAVRRRAVANGVHLLAAAEVKGVTAYLKSWMSGR